MFREFDLKTIYEGWNPDHDTTNLNFRVILFAYNCNIAIGYKRSVLIDRITNFLDTQWKV